MLHACLFSVLLSWVVSQGGVPSSPYPPIEGSITPAAVHKTSGERWETTLTVKDEDTWINAALQPVIVCNPNTGVTPREIPSHEPSAEAVLTQSGWVNCVKTFIRGCLVFARP